MAIHRNGNAKIAARTNAWGAGWAVRAGSAGDAVQRSINRRNRVAGQAEARGGSFTRRRAADWALSAVGVAGLAKPALRTRW